MALAVAGGAAAAWRLAGEEASAVEDLAGAAYGPSLDLFVAPPTATPTETATATPTPSPTPPPPPTATTAPVPHVHTPVPPAAPQEQAPPEPQPRVWSDPAFAGRVLTLINAERSARGLAPLATDGALTASATGYAETLLRLGALSHNADGTDVLSRARAAGYGGGLPVGEVSWRGVGSLPPENVVSGWMSSGSHRDVVLSGQFRVAGVGCYFRDDGGMLEARCVMDLGAG